VLQKIALPSLIFHSGSFRVETELGLYSSPES